MNFKKDDRVRTDYGPGTVVHSEGKEGVLSKRFLVKLDKCPFKFLGLHNQHGGMFFHHDELQINDTLF